MSSQLSAAALTATIACGTMAAVVVLAIIVVCVCRATARWQRAAGSRWRGREGRLLRSGPFPEYGVGVVEAGSSKSSEPSLAGSLMSWPSRGSSWRSASGPGGTAAGRPSYHSRSEETGSIGSAKELGSLEPSLYTRKESTVLIVSSESDNAPRRSGNSAAGTMDSAEPKLGKVVFRLGYSFNTSDLLVHVLRAADLVSCDRQKDFVDPFVTLSLEPPVDSKERQTSLQRKTNCPAFDQTFKFPLDFDSLEGHRLRLLVQDFDKFSRHAPVGEFSLNLSSIDVTSEPEVMGSLRPTDENQCINGELLFSLSFLPGAEKLTIAVMKARNLRQVNADRFPDPYVRVTLLHGEKCIKKRKKTTSKKRALNPVWNEAMTFRVTPEILPGLSIEVAVLDRDLLGQDAAVGSVRLGNDTDSRSGRRHWKETIANPRRALAMWHPLAGSATGTST